MDDSRIAPADSSKYFFVDEAGDMTLVGRRGRILLGTPGVSNYFMVGIAEISDPNALAEDLDSLRQEILADSYFQGIPSIDPTRGKTARCFHAHADCAEVRFLVYRTLAQFDIKVIIGIRRKSVLAEFSRQARAKGVKVNPDTIYDDMVKTAFKNLLHKAESNTIYFARRGKSDRQKALEQAISRAQRNFSKKTGILSDKPTVVRSAVPSDEAGLQAVDYCLWAVQRLYERGEDRYFNAMQGCYKLIMDFDDTTSGKPYGSWYSKNNMLTKEKLLPTIG